MTLLAGETDNARAVHAQWRRLSAQRTLYSVIGFGALLLAVIGSFWFADESNAGHFFDRLPHLFDFLILADPQGLERRLARAVRPALAVR